MFGTKLRRAQGGYLLSIVAAVVCVLLALLLFVNRQYVVDQLSVWQYQPSSEVAALVDRTKMSDTGRFLFYASKPAIENAQKFNQVCDRKENSTAILGCYDGRSIYIYDVTDARLGGIKEVTAAHEMLHAAYARLNDDEKKTVNALVEAEYKKLKDDKEFAKRMAFYARTEPGERANELHSMIATEVAAISPELEKHYKRYFADRLTVVRLHADYDEVFSQLQKRADELSARLRYLYDSIQRDTAAYNSRAEQYNRDMDTFNARADGGFSSREEYDAALAVLMARADELDAFHDAIETDIQQYISLQKELAGVAGRSKELHKSIDSSLAPAPEL